MEISLAYLQQQRDNLAKQVEELRARHSETAGAFQFCLYLIQQMEKQDTSQADHSEAS